MSSTSQTYHDNPKTTGKCSLAERSLDWVVAIFLLVLLAPFILFVAFFIAVVSKGPIIFRQVRVGQGGRKFMMFKFRTMSLDACGARHVSYSSALMRSGRPMAKLDFIGDTRLIPFGRFLRASGIDEIPQIINVFRGEMSIVGPRPCLPGEFEAYGPDQMKRFAIKPGITGLWQVSGKNDLSFDQMIGLDEQYIHNKSVGYNFYILFRTPLVLVKQVLRSFSSKVSSMSELSANESMSDLETKIAG